MQIQYTVEPVTIYRIKRMHAREGVSGEMPQGDYESEDTAYEVAEALCRRERDQMGLADDDDRVKYPVRPE